ncbi:MAG TPA: 30S ribosomal protein S8 [Dehalococcoidia bacterium]|nr:30S ribosomal protein S8 [Dehalococcoidia bacterium]
MVTDPIADMLTRIRNALMVRHDTVTVPASKTKLVIAKILKDEGFITDFTVVKGKVDKTIKISLRYLDNQPVINGLERVSKPGLRVYVGSGEVPRVYGGLGISILSTSKGIMVGQDAWKQKLGGELMCHIW